MTRTTEKRERILAGLREHATAAGAARAAGVSPSTVRRLLDADQLAQQALGEGLARQARDRVAACTQSMHDTEAALAGARAETDALRTRLAVENPELDYVQLRDLDRKLSELHKQEKPLLRRLQARRKALKLARDRARTHGVDPDAPAPEPS